MIPLDLCGHPRPYPTFPYVGLLLVCHPCVFFFTPGVFASNFLHPVRTKFQPFPEFPARVAGFPHVRFLVASIVFVFFFPEGNLAQILEVYASWNGCCFPIGRFFSMLFHRHHRKLRTQNDIPSSPASVKLRNLLFIFLADYSTPNYLVLLKIL